LIYDKCYGIISGHLKTGENMKGINSEGHYKKLARHLDRLPPGFPETENGVELRILKRLFTPDEAELAVHLTLLFEEADVIAKKAKKPAAETRRKLEEMASKGLIYSLYVHNKAPRFRANMFVIGIWEFNVNNLDKELIRDMEEYMPTLLDAETWKKAPQLRTIPVQESIPVRHEVMAYENAEKLVESHKKYLVAPCICRRERKMIGEGCDRPEEACLIFGRGVDYYQNNGMGRKISKEETLEILKKADQAGLVLQTTNAQKIANICTCCGCCCGVLRTIKRHPKPATFIASPYLAGFDPSTCSSCETCIERCQMEAIVRGEDSIALDLDRCIGCGLCVTTCPTGSLTLARKPSSSQKAVPENLTRTYINIARVRGRLNVLKLVTMWFQVKMRKLRSKGR
jgi:Fe-S-cluster-containing hydrogenase component 2